MSYVKQNFVDGQILTAEHMNHIEDGIEAASAENGAGLTGIEKEYMLRLFQNAAYTTDSVKYVINDLRKEWGYGPLGVLVESLTLSATALTMTEGETKTLTTTVLPANPDRLASFSVSPGGFVDFVDTDESTYRPAPGVYVHTLKALKAGVVTFKALVGDKEARCTVTVKAADAETAQLLYNLPGETALTKGLDTGVKLFEHASTESPQYTILLDAKASDNFNDKGWIVFLHCMTETGDNSNLPGININLNPNKGTTNIAYYDFSDVTLSDSIAHLKTRTRYVIQLDGKKYRGGSTYCALSDWWATKRTLTDVPENLLIGGAPGTSGSELTRCWVGTLYQCKVYKGLLSDEKINKFIQEGTV